jgi:tripartite-type tricarboxylate transporter receptor subunit TctC
VRIILPFPPGGSNDAVARPLAEHLQNRFGQPFVIENRAGAIGVIGTAEVARAPADGLTLLSTSSSFATAAATQRTPYDASRDFEAVAMVAAAPLVVIAAPSFAPNSLVELIEHVRAHPGEVVYGSAGPGSINHLTAELFAQQAGGLQMLHVPYRGMGPATTDLAAGTIHVIFTTVPSASGVINAGRAKVIGWTGEDRPATGPMAPTPGESGLTGFDARIWWGLLARAGTPPEIRNALNVTANEAISGGRLAAYLASQGATPTPRSAAEGHDFLQRDLAKWKQVATTARIAIE